MADPLLYEYKTIDSTNSEAKRYAMAGGSAPAVFAAREQTAGRGRMGREFYSPANTGLYYSLLLPLPERTEDILRLTSAAAVVTAEAISSVFGIETAIKWVNDIYDVDGKKLAGILAESFPWEGRRYGIVGIGINLCTKDFPKELSDIAASLCSHLTESEIEQKRASLIAALTDGLLAFAERPDDPSIMEQYRSRSLVLGREVRFIQNGLAQTGLAEEISDTGALTVRLPNGERLVLASGEITLRPISAESKNSKGKNE